MGVDNPSYQPGDEKRARDWHEAHHIAEPARDLIERGEYQMALGLCRRAISIDRADDILVTMAEALFGLGQYDESLQVCEEVIREGTTAPCTHATNLKAFILAVAGRYQEAAFCVVSDYLPSSDFLLGYCLGREGKHIKESVGVLKARCSRESIGKLYLVLSRCQRKRRR